MDVAGSPLLVSIEIPGAGRTLTDALRAAFGPQAGHSMPGFWRDARGAHEQLGNPGPGIRYAYGSVAYGAVRHHVPPDARFITMLRDPVQRTIAQHRVLRRAAEAKLAAADPGVRSIGTPAGSLAEAAASFPHLLDNAMTRVLSGLRTPFGEVPPEALERAKEALQDGFAVVGVLERIEESLAVLGKVVGIDQPAAFATPAILDDELDEADRLTAIELNQLDLELYAYANRLLDEAFGAPRGVEGRRIAFVEVPGSARPIVRPVLSHRFGEAAVRPIGDETFDLARTRAQIARLDANRHRSVDAIIGMTSLALLSSALPADTHFVTFLRDPVARALEPGFDIVDNLATRMLCGQENPLDDLDPDALEKAKRNLRESFALVGVVERFEESLALLARLVGVDVADLPPRAFVRPVTSVSSDRRDEIERRDHLDVELYAEACRLLDAAVEAGGSEVASQVEFIRGRVTERRGRRGVFRNKRIASRRQRRGAKGRRV